MGHERLKRPLWLTRDSFPSGGTMGWVDVWDTKPQRFLDYHEEGAVWLNPESRNTSGRCMFMSVRECVEEFGVAPDDDWMIVRIGR